MAKFVWQPEGQQPIAFAIRQERVGVGRDAGNDIRLPEPAVSSRHAAVITRMGQSTVHDLNSSNGTWVNGHKIESQLLQHGDVVQFGRLSMTFVDESSAASAPPSGQTDRTQQHVVQPQPAKPKPSATGAFQTTTLQSPPQALDLTDLDRLIGAIRDHRNGETQQNEKKREEMLLEWNKVMGYCTALKKRLSSEPRVRFFEVSERRNEVVIRVEAAVGQPTHLVMLTWGHAEQGERALNGIWVRQPGQLDKRYEHCTDVMRDLVATIAHMLV